MWCPAILQTSNTTTSCDVPFAWYPKRIYFALGQHIPKEDFNDIKDAKYYGIVSDLTPDVSNTEQFSEGTDIFISTIRLELLRSGTDLDA